MDLARLNARGFHDLVIGVLDEFDHTGAERLADALWACRERDRFCWVVGNGGSAANASHLAEDVTKGSSAGSGRGFRVMSLTDAPHLLAIGNDCGFDRVFLDQLRRYASPGDLLVAISGSGNSPNVLKAVEYARESGVAVFACTGFDGGRLRQLAPGGLHVGCNHMGVVESVHLTAFHWVVDELARRVRAEP